MKKTIFEEMGGTYIRHGDYLIPCLALPEEEEQRFIGVWGQRHLRYLKEYRRSVYLNLLTSGRLNSYLADIEEQAQERFERIVDQMKQKSSQNMAGNRRSVQKGTSAEFSDFREYMPGDDLRRLDWNVYARSERMYIREYFEEKEAVVSVILDTSASMHYGKKGKAELAQDLCAVIAFPTLHHMDRLVLYDSSQMGTPLVVSGGKNALPKVLGWLQARTFSGTETDSFP